MFFSFLPKVTNPFSRYLGLSSLLVANTKRKEENHLTMFGGERIGQLQKQKRNKTTKKPISVSYQAEVRDGQTCHWVTLCLWVTGDSIV